MVWDTREPCQEFRLTDNHSNEVLFPRPMYGSIWIRNPDIFPPFFMSRHGNISASVFVTIISVIPKDEIKHQYANKRRINTKIHKETRKTVKKTLSATRCSLVDITTPALFTEKVNHPPNRQYTCRLCLLWGCMHSMLQDQRHLFASERAILSSLQRLRLDITQSRLFPFIN